MYGPYSASGIDGVLRLVFLNDRLMSTEFSTNQGPEYLALLERKRIHFPAGQGSDIDIDRRTRLRYVIDNEGVFKFTWVDPKLEHEWHQWVRNNA